MTDMMYFIKLLETKAFNKEQCEEIKVGFKSGLSQNEVGVYAKPEFTKEQMIQLRKGFDMGLSIEQVRSYANPWLNPCLMADARYKIIHCL